MSSIIVAGLLGLLVTLAAIPFVKRLAVRIGALAFPMADRWHCREVPLLGGVAIVAAVGLGALVLSPRAREIWILLGGACTLFLVGLVDDFRPLKPHTKFVAQILVAATLIAFGLQLRLTASPALNLLLTLVWIVGITNAFNLLDNMDGLAAGVAAIATGFRFAFFLADGSVEAAALAALLAGALVGFLVHNFHPASIFMGDAGSLFIGVMVGGLNLLEPLAYSRGTASVLLFPVLILLVPIFDTAFVMAARTIAGRPLALGGRDHPSHRLVALGLSEREAVIVLYVVAVLAGCVAVISYRYHLSYTAVLVAWLIIALVLFGTYLGRLRVYPEQQVNPGEGARFVTFIANVAYKREIATVLLDFVFIVLAYYTAYLLRFEEAAGSHHDRFIATLPIVIACQLMAFALFRVYRGVWRYTSLRDLVTLGLAVTIGTTATVVVVRLVFGFGHDSRSVFVLDWLLLGVFVSSSRLFFRSLPEFIRPRGGDFRRVLIYGAGDGGVMVLRELRNNPALQREIVGFIDDDRSKHRTKVQGVPVLGGFRDLESAIRRSGVNEVIISSEKVPAGRVSQLTDLCEAFEVAVMRASLRLE